jgi:capsular exopolysaccharide synthesis family protein
MTSVSRLYAGLALGMGWLAGIAVALLATRFFVSGTGDLDGSNAFVNAVNRLSEPFLQASGMGLLPRGEGFDRRAVFAVVIILAALAVLARVLVLCSRRSPQAKSMIIRGKTPGRYASSCYDLGEQMAQALRTSGKKSVLFTSSVSGEGTSPLVADLGSVFATRPGTRVLLIDANLRKPALHRLLGLDNGAGLGELLSGEAKLSDVVREASGQLSVITAGRQDAVLTSGLFDSDAMRLLMERVHDGFDLVLVDCACLQSFQDAGILSSYVDAVVLAVREGKAKVEVISHVLAGLERKKAPLLGGVLTNRTFSVPRFLYERA